MRVWGTDERMSMEVKLACAPSRRGDQWNGSNARARTVIPRAREAVPEPERQQEEPRREEARGVTRIDERHWAGEDALTRLARVTEEDDTLVHLHLLLLVDW